MPLQNEKNVSSQKQKIAIVLSGGGARGAYQAGVMKGLGEILPEEKLHFDIISGVSAGAINASYLAASSHDMHKGVEGLAKLWNGLNSSDIYETGVTSLSRHGAKLAFGGLIKNSSAISLLRTEPLHRLLEQQVDFSRIVKNLENKCIESVVVTATDYSSVDNVAFYDSKVVSPQWSRARRISRKTELNISHIMASSAIPIFFPPVSIEGRPYGDGCLRNAAPLSPAIKLGAEKIFLVGVRKIANQAPKQNYHANLGRQIGILLNSVFMESTDHDLERLELTNQLIRKFTGDTNFNLRPIDYLYLTPSVDLGDIAAKTYESLPKSIKFLLRGMGDKREASEIVSYLMFEPRYCQSLIELGRQDVFNQKEAIQKFMNVV